MGYGFFFFSPEGDAAVEDNEEQEETDEQDEEKMKTSDEVEDDKCDNSFIALHQHSSNASSLPVNSPTGHSWTRSNSVRGHVIPGQLHPAQQIHLF